MYRGWFCEDVREGEGRMEWSDGSTYEGAWERGLPNGRGKNMMTQAGVYKARGEKPRRGLFKDNKLISESKGKESQGQFLQMIPELLSSRGTKKRRGKSVLNSTGMSTKATFKLTRYSVSKPRR